jgi:hypothetical protein
MFLNIMLLDNPAEIPIPKPSSNTTPPSDRRYQKVLSCREFPVFHHGMSENLKSCSKIPSAFSVTFIKINI